MKEVNGRKWEYEMPIQKEEKNKNKTMMNESKKATEQHSFKWPAFEEDNRTIGRRCETGSCYVSIPISGKTSRDRTGGAWRAVPVAVHFE